MFTRRALVAAFALPLALVACSSDNSGKSAEPQTAPAPAPAQTPPPPPKTVTPSAQQAPTPGQPAPSSASRTGMKVRFGIMPGNYDDDQDGVEVGEVYEGTSAGDAGIKQGDRLMTWNGKKITTVENWMQHMAPHKVGDVVDVGVLRDGQIVPIKVTLKAG